MVKGIHARWSALLKSLPESSWEKAGVHLENGLMTLDDILKTYSGHGQVHLDQIGRIKAGLGS